MPKKPHRLHLKTIPPPQPSHPYNPTTPNTNTAPLKTSSRNTHLPVRALEANNLFCLSVVCQLLLADHVTELKNTMHRCTKCEHHICTGECGGWRKREKLRRLSQGGREGDRSYQIPNSSHILSSQTYQRPRHILLILGTKKVTRKQLVQNCHLKYTFDHSDDPVEKYIVGLPQWFLTCST